MANSESDQPELKQRIEFRSEKKSEAVEKDFGVEAQFHFLTDHPDVNGRWEKYLDEKWRPWALEDRRRRVLQRVYDELFSIHQTQQRLGEQYEVVLGIGLLNWNRNGLRVQRHIVVAQALVKFNASRGVISVKASPDGARMQLEEDMLDPGDRPPASIQQRLQRQLVELDNRVWAADETDDILRSWVQAFNSNGHFESTLFNTPYRSTNPIITFAPAIILRRRSERSMIQMFTDIGNQIEEGEVGLPMGVKRLVEVADDVGFDTDGTSTQARSMGMGEIYFPLPANAEQREIVQRLTQRQGVVTFRGHLVLASHTP